MSALRIVSITVLVSLFLAGLIGPGEPVRAIFSDEPDSLPQDLRFRHLTVEEGLPHATVLMVLQDQQGFMWFATADGLARYDGYDFIVFRHDPADPNSLSNNNVFALIQSRDGLIWVGTDPGGLNVYDPKTGKFSLFLHDENDPNSLADNSVWSLLEAQDGSIWVGTRGGLSRLDRNTGQFTNYVNDPENPRSLAHPVVYRLYQDRAGTLWVGTQNGLQRYDPKTDDFTLFANDPDDPTSISQNSIWAMLEDSRGNFWVGTRGGGLNLMDRKTGRFKAYRNDPEDPFSISDDNLWCIYEDSAGRIWIATENGGLNVFDPEAGKFRSFQYNPNDPHSISHNDVHWITEDRSGVLWITSRYGGVNILSPAIQRFGWYRNIPGDPRSLSSNSIFSVLAEGDGIVWVATFGGGLNRIDKNNGEVTVFRNEPGNSASLSSDKLYFLHRDRQGVLWITTSGGGLNRMDPLTGEFTAYRYSPDDESIMNTNYPTAIEDAGDGKLWVGTLGYGIVLFDPETGKMARTYEPNPNDPNSLAEGTIYDLEADEFGNLWIATARGGLELLDPDAGTFTHHRHNPDNLDSILSDTVNAIFIDKARGVVWAGTAGGLSGLDLASGNWRNYTSRSGLPSDTITAIEPDGSSSLWISTTNGLSHFFVDTETFRNYNIQDGLPGKLYSMGCSSTAPDGELFFCGSNGVTFFHTSDITDDPHPAPVIFTEFLLFNQPVETGSELLPQAIENVSKITLSHDQSVFSIGFVGLNYQSPVKNTYQYKMEGFDRDWSPPRSNRQATYTNLPPGIYTFQVRAANSSGIWNETAAELIIEIKPPWWGTLWFKMAAGTGLFLLAMGGVQLRLKEIRARNRELEKRVEERTRELQEAQKQLREQAIHDALTGLFNRHYMSEVLKTEFARANRKQHSVAFLLIDMDDFKKINDQYGHTIGDQVLQATGRLIRDGIRQSDSAFRYGGEEFLLILPDLTAEAALERAEQLRQAIDDLDLVSEGKKVATLCSIGVAIYPHHGANSDDILNRADKALYRAKELGGNRTVLYSE
jgi:diguanylate cyclase (GGDEF)-like protein